MAFAAKPAVAASVGVAFDELWGPEFAKRDDDERAAGLERPEAEAGSVTYCLLDAPTASGTTIAEQFLAKHAKTLSPEERDYLQRLAATRMGLYRIDEVHLDRGLTCTDLWTNERIDVREKKLTHGVEPSWVIGVRTFPTSDGGTELDGAVYVFREAEAHQAVRALKALRNEWTAARKNTPALDEALFLKRRFPVLIHRHWFDDAFFSADAAPQEHFGVGAVEPLHRKHLADLQYFHISDPQVQELAAFLHSSAAPTAMTIDRVHGFLCAINCAPKIIRPQSWLPLIGGAEAMEVRSKDHSAQIIAALFALSNQIVEQLRDGTFEPLLPSRPGSGMDNVAQGWCLGFVEGMALQQRSWKQLMEEPESQMMIVPILALADASALVEDATPNPAATAAMVKLLPTAVAMICDYSAQVKLERTATRTTRGRPARTATRTQSGAAVAGTVHRLKITLEGVRPAIWRRVEIPSDAKLPFVGRALIATMGWNDTHLHAFRVGRATYGDPDPDFPTGMRSERSVTLAQIAPRAKDHFFFDYDFGDNWEHRVVVESIEPAGDGDGLRCLGGARACPPDDCGGIGGYRDLLKILGNPRNSEYRQMRMWAGEDFDAEFFDVDEVNRALQRLARSARKRSRR